ncbi:MAG: hypothetical protein U9R08_01355 [Nanoarchaeota archaeon]|nr:hypothetical protein [Nanoarchaeota archaeon]
MKLIFPMFFLIFILTSSFVMSANLYGSVYDPDLNIQPKTRIEINTVPKQVYFSNDGHYNFPVFKGNFTIFVTYSENDLLVSYVEKNISIINNKDYLFDLVLSSKIENEVLDLEIVEAGVAEEEVVEEKKISSIIGLLLLIAVIISMIILVSYSFRKVTRMIKEDLEELSEKSEVKSKVEDLLDKRILDFIVLNGGEVLQKEIRKQFFSSEAKISLVLTELEHLGKVKKIKKGRGNVIILQ